MWNNIHPITILLFVTSLLMNFSTATIINLALNDIPSFLFVKSLSKASGYVGKFLVGWISDIFKCNKLILRVGYGSIFVIKPMFYFAMRHFFSDESYNLYLLVLADCLDQIFNNFRDISRDAIIARIVKNNHLSRNLFFRKAGTIAGTVSGIGFALYISSKNSGVINNSFTGPVSIAIMIASIASFIGYFFLERAFKYVEENTSSNKFTWKSVLDLRLWSLVSILLFLFVAILKKFNLIFSLSIGILLIIVYFVISGIYYFYYKKKNENAQLVKEDETIQHMDNIPILNNRMYLFDNRTFTFVSILVMFLFLFSVNYYSMLDILQSLMNSKPKEFAIFRSIKSWKQTVNIFYYFVSLISSLVLSIINLKRISNILAVYIASFIVIGISVMSRTLVGFVFAIIGYGIVNSLFEPAINSYIIRHTQKFSYKGITLGLFSVFNSIGIILSIIISQIFGNLHNMHMFALCGNVCVAIILLILSYFKKDKLKEI